MKSRERFIEQIKNNKCPNCKSKRLNIVPGYNETNNRKTYYCMDCENEFDRLGRYLPPVYC